MKGFLLRKMKIMPYAVALLFFVSLNTINAQCPTVPVSPQVICDAAGFYFNDLNSFSTPAPGNHNWLDKVLIMLAIQQELAVLVQL
jgi:hypothetical protein